MGLATGVALAAFAPATSAQAQGVGQTVFSKIFGFGDDSEPAINYSERAPIVIPPKRDMRLPARDAAALAEDPNWPKDPDEKKRRKKRIEGGVGPATSKAETLLTPAELAAGGHGGPLLDTSGQTALQIEAERRRLLRPISPLEMKKKMHLAQDETPLVPGVEPPRRSLVDPPPGLRAPVATAPLAGDEPLPSEVSAGEVPFYKRWFSSK